MPNTTDKHKKKVAPIVCAILAIGALAIYLSVLVLPLINASVGDILAVGFLLLLMLAIVAMITGVVIALRQRLREIEGGEEEDAKQY